MHEHHGLTAGDKVTFHGVRGNRVAGVIDTVDPDGARCVMRVTARTNPVYPAGYRIHTSTTWIKRRK